MMNANPLLSEALTAVEREKRTPQAELTLQLPDVLARTAALFTITVLTAVAGWVALPANGFTMLVLPLAAFGVAMWAFFRKTINASLPLLFAVLEGAVVGVISRVFAERYGSDIVVTAVLATAVVFAVCLVVYRIPRVRNSTQGRRVFLVLLISYLVFSILSLGAGVFFGVGDGWGFFGLGLLGIAVAAFAIALSAWSLIVNFGDTERAITGGAPVAYAWLLSLGLLISTVWLYLSILRFLGLVRR